MKTVSLNELVYELLELRRANTKTTDPLDERLVIDWIQSTRAMLLKQKFSQPFSFVDDHYVQHLGEISMTRVLSSTSIGLSGDEEKYVYRTIIAIPKPIKTKDGCGLFTRIGPADMLSDGFQITTYKKAFVSGNGKFNRNTVFAFVLGDYVYLYSRSGYHFGIPTITISGVFQDPIAAARIANPSWTYDDDYPINKELIDRLKSIIVSSKFPLVLTQMEDKTDDREDNVGGKVIGVSKGETQDNSGL